MANWDPEAEYQFGFGSGYFFAGKKMKKVRGGGVEEVPFNHEKQVKTFEELLEHLASVATKQRDGLPFLIIDDCSPMSLDPERLESIVAPNPLLWFRPSKNLGVGGKENIIQAVLGERCEFVAKFDADIKLDPFKLDDLVKGFKKHEDAWAITSCITYFARLEAASLPEKQRWFSGSNIADFVVYRSSIFDDIGYTDPAVRYNEDGEYRLRALAALGMKCYVDKELTGKASPSGAGASWEARLESGRFVDKTRPFIKVIFPKDNGTPRLTLDKKRVAEAKGFTIPPSPVANLLASRVWA